MCELSVSRIMTSYESGGDRQAVKTVEIAEATNPLADYVPGVRTEPLIITDHGTPAAVMLPLDNVDLESVSLSTNPAFMALIERSRARARDEGEVTADEMRRRGLGMP
jgi:prevent-host-death family protein